MEIFDFEIDTLLIILLYLVSIFVAKNSRIKNNS